ncbi:MAG: poly-gamma-glutamate system protein, partial [Gemmatimonadetes bacterium]|nr:poly-gamma-glutamate system protein [Gemmatimonadota bacterium]
MKAVPHVDGRLTRRIVAAAVVSLVAWVALESLSPRPTVTWSEEMHDAAGRMWEAIAVIAGHHGTVGIRIDEAIDPNRTGLIGPEYTELFTTLGQLEAKRTTTNPDVSALLVHLLRRAGVTSGDTIAVGASASFPALMIATVTAAEAMGAHPVAILSLGA